MEEVEKCGVWHDGIEFDTGESREVICDYGTLTMSKEAGFLLRRKHASVR